jgi:hypothetical protein
MNSACLHMPQPPVKPDEPGSFEKLLGKGSHQHRRSGRGRHNRAYDADELRRGQSLLAAVVVTLLVIGGFLIFSGMLCAMGLAPARPSMQPPVSSVSGG